MSFAAPLALWLLLPLALVLLDRFRRRNRRRVRVGTIAIWRALADREAARTRRPRPPLELLVEAALGLTLVLLAAGPRLEARRPPELVVVVDAGSAMATPERSETLGRALERIARDSGREPLLRRWPPTSGPGPVVSDEVAWAPRLAALVAPDREVWLVADAVADLERIPESVGLAVIDSPLANVGIVAAAVDRVAAQLRVHVVLAASTDAATPGIRLVLRDGEGRALATQAIAFGSNSMQTTLELLIDEPGGDRLALEIEGAAGPAFDDRVVIERGGAAPRFLLAPFAGSEAWAAALEAADRKAVRGSEPAAAGVEMIPILSGSPPARGPALVLAASSGRPGRMARIVEPAIEGQAFAPEAGGVLADMPAVGGLGGASGACFELRDEGIRVLARRGGRPVVVFDPGPGLLLLADPESLGAWADAVAFPVLVARLSGLLAEAADGGGRWLAGPLSTPGETAGAAAPATASRPARPGVPRLSRRDLRLETALLGLVLLGFLAFLRLKGPARRESAGPG